MIRLSLFFLGLTALTATAQPLQTFYVTPDHFEIETVNSVASLQVANDRFGTTASVTFVPAYDSALHAIGFAFRKSTDEIQVRTLPIEVTDFSFGNGAFLKSMAVDGVEKKILGERVVVSIRFGNDITPAQARAFISLSMVMGTIEAKVGMTDGVPESLKGTRLKEIAALNQFHNKERSSGKNSALAKYRMLNHYKSEVTLTQVDLISNPFGLDEWVKKKLMQGHPGRRECRRNLDADDDWVCRIILEQSPDGCLSEALFSIATRLFPPRIIGAEYSRFVFDTAGKSVNWLQQGVPSPDFEKGPSQFERILASRSNPSMTEGEYAVRVNEYVSTLFPRFAPIHRASIVASLLSIRSLEEDSASIRAMMSVAMRSAELSQSLNDRAGALVLALATGKGPGSDIERLFKARTDGILNEVQFEAGMQRWMRVVFHNKTENERIEYVKAIMSYTSLTSNGAYNRVAVSHFLQDIEGYLSSTKCGPVRKSDALNPNEGDEPQLALMLERLTNYLDKNMPELSKSEKENVLSLFADRENSPEQRALWTQLLEALEVVLEK